MEDTKAKKRRIPSLSDLRNRLRSYLWRVLIKPVLKGIAILLIALLAAFFLYATHYNNYVDNHRRYSDETTYYTRTGEQVTRASADDLVKRFPTNEAFHIFFFREWVGNEICYWITLVWGITLECTVNTVWGVPR